ncbi:hypothetical protein VTJ49DRAFT_1384 [Mycothermus thermophilus]|uniref:Calcineurin-like phosphoesterase domain-containing protein n=1 Tax=Humicola insolens TaxID=85995 RepID=A0ABR3VD04_HUMIN
MALQILSDLHLEALNEYEAFEIVPRAPNLGLLGDIGIVIPEHKDDFLAFLKRQLRQFRTVLLVPGNHEAYGSTWDETISILSAFADAVRADPDPSLGEFVLLSRTAVRLPPPHDDVVVLGCSLFSRVPDVDEDAEARTAIATRVNDFQQTRGGWDVNAHTAAHARDLAWLNEQVTALEQAGDSNTRIAILTHWSPTRDSRSAHPQYEGSVITSAFSTDLSREVCFRSGRVKVWAFGHTHYNCDFLVERSGSAGPLRLVTNQRGYSFRPAKGFDGEKTVELTTASQDPPKEGPSLWHQTAQVLEETTPEKARPPGPNTSETAAEVEPPEPSPGHNDETSAVAEPSITERQPTRPNDALSALKTVLHQELEGTASEPTAKSATSPESKPGAKSTPAKKPEPQPRALSKAPWQLKPSSKRKKHLFSLAKINAKKVKMIPVEGKKQPPVPRLAYGLDRVLFNPGVYHLQDPRSRVFNFDPYLSRIMPVNEFDYKSLKQYITSSKDVTLIQMAARHRKKYTGSTSSMTSTLSHFHYLLSAWRPLDYSMLSRNFEVDSHRTTRILRAPAAVFLHWKDGVYAIDADKEFDSANILMHLGKSMEKLLTLPKEDFEKYRKSRSDELTDEEKYGPEAYHYSTLGSFLMRSQLDAYDPRLPGTGMFDLKTRAVISIRMEARDYQRGLGYEIRTRFGQWESFEREYYDMIRSAFLKYSLQVRMGRMDGIFVAFHNTQRVFGFQYIPLEEMDQALHGQDDRTLGDAEFRLSLHLLNKILDRVTKKYPKRTLRLHFEARGEDAQPFMYVFAKPVTEAEVERIQNATREKVEAYERQLLGLVKEEEEMLANQQILEEEEVDEEEEEDEEELEEGEEEEMVEEADEHDLVDDAGDGMSSSVTWDDVMLRVEDELEDEENGVTIVRDAIEDALQESGLLRSYPPETARRYIDDFLEALTGIRVKDRGFEAKNTENAIQEAVEEGENIPEDTSDEPTLKDLLVRLATQIRNLPSEQRTPTGEVIDVIDEDASEYMQRLRKVESILAELTAQPPEEADHVKKTAGNGVVETGTISAEEDLAELTEQPPKDSQTAATTEEDTTAATTKTTSPQLDEPTDGELYGLILTIRNRVDNAYVVRPENLVSKQADWMVEYAMEELEPDHARTLYEMVLKRRRALLYPDDEGGPVPVDGNDNDSPDGGSKKPSNSYRDQFFRQLERWSERGREFRRKEDARLRCQPIHVLGEDTPYSYQSIMEAVAEDGTRPYAAWESGGKKAKAKAKAE